MKRDNFNFKTFVRNLLNENEQQENNTSFYQSNDLVEYESNPHRHNVYRRYIENGFKMRGGGAKIPDDIKYYIPSLHLSGDLLRSSGIGSAESGDAGQRFSQIIIGKGIVPNEGKTINYDLNEEVPQLNIRKGFFPTADIIISNSQDPYNITLNSGMLDFTLGTILYSAKRGGSTTMNDKSQRVNIVPRNASDANLRTIGLFLGLKWLEKNNYDVNYGSIIGSDLSNLDANGILTALQGAGVHNIKYDIREVCISTIPYMTESDRNVAKNLSREELDDRFPILDAILYHPGGKVTFDIINDTLSKDPSNLNGFNRENLNDMELKGIIVGKISSLIQHNPPSDMKRLHPYNRIQADVGTNSFSSLTLSDLPLTLQLSTLTALSIQRFDKLSTSFNPSNEDMSQLESWLFTQLKQEEIDEASIQFKAAASILLELESVLNRVESYKTAFETEVQASGMQQPNTNAIEMSNPETQNQTQQGIDLSSVLTGNFSESSILNLGEALYSSIVGDTGIYAKWNASDTEIKRVIEYIINPGNVNITLSQTLINAIKAIVKWQHNVLLIIVRLSLLSMDCLRNQYNSVSVFHNPNNPVHVKIKELNDIVADYNRINVEINKIHTDVNSLTSTATPSIPQLQNLKSKYFGKPISPLPISIGDNKSKFRNKFPFKNESLNKKYSLSFLFENDENTTDVNTVKTGLAALGNILDKIKDMMSNFINQLNIEKMSRANKLSDFKSKYNFPSVENIPDNLNKIDLEDVIDDTEWSEITPAQSQQQAKLMSESKIRKLIQLAVLKELRKRGKR